MNIDDNRCENSHGERQSSHVAENEQGKANASSFLDNDERRTWTEIQHGPDLFSLLDNINNFSIAEIRQKIAVACGVQSSQIEDAFPCTPLQEGLLALSAHLPGYYVAQYNLQLRPDVDDVTLQATWNHVYATTPILRTRIVDLTGEGLVQTIIDEPFEWTAGDDLDGYLYHDSQRTTGTGTPLARFALINDHKRKNRFFVWTMHHALYDFTSVPLLVKRVNDVHLGKQPAASAPFQNFVKHMKKIEVSSAERIWKQHLDGNEAPIYPPLPDNKYRPKADQTLSHVIKDLPWSREGGTQTMPMVWAAWAVLMGQHAAADEAVFGVTTFGRQAQVAGIESMTGPTMATMPLRVELAEKMTVTEFVCKLQRSAAELATVEQYGLQRIRKISIDAERACNFQTLVDVNLQEEYLNPKDGPFDPSSLENVSASDNAQNGPLFSTFALKVQFKLLECGLDCMFTFDSRIVGSDEASSLQRQLEHVLRQLCDPRNSDVQLSDIDWIGPSDLGRIWTWNETVPRKANDCVHDLISQTAQTQPDAPAICAWDGQLTYGELDRISTDLAHYLVSQGVERGTIVPLCFEKSMWTSVSIQGVMKAGGTCVTMDTTQPEAHLQRIAGQVSGKVLLSSVANKAMAERMAGDHTNVIIPQAFFSLPRSTHSKTRLPTVDPSDRVYIVFTSGSTGTPKGAMITHSNFSSAIFHQRRPLGMQRKDRVFDYVSYAFDVSWLNALLTLAVGACLCVPSEAERRDDIAASIRRYSVTYADLTPSITRLIEPSEVPSLRHLTFGGEEVLVEDVIRWSHLQEAVNAYGPAECTPKSHAYDYISEASKLANEIGWGTGLNSWVTQPENPNKLAIIGALGELWLEGPLVGAGYLGEREKTAAAYIKNPAWLLSGGPGHSGRSGRLYKTGDLVRYNPNGSLIYVKRKDAQLKVRGQRVELAEIEHHARNALAFQKGELSVVCALILPKGSDNKILTAFFSTSMTDNNAGESTLGACVSQATETLQERVPSYMIPGAWVFLQRMPMSATGKTDRRKLQAIGSSMTLEELTSLGNTYKEGGRRAPTTPTELRLQAAWASTLQTSAEKLGLDDNFLRIGGDSILAVRLVTAARREGLSIKVSDIFQKPTLAGLATLAIEIPTSASVLPESITPFSILRPGTDIAHMRSQAAAACGVPHDLIQDAFPCTPLQEGLMALSTRRKGDYMPRFVLPLKDSIDIGRFRNAWSQMAAATPILRTRIVDIADHGLVQVVLDEGVIWETKESDLDEYLEREQPIAAGLGLPLVRYELIRDHKLQRTFFVWTIHHSLYDGWSMDLMIRRAQQLYRDEALSPIIPFQNFVKRVSMDMVQASAERTWIEFFDGLGAPPFPSISSTTFQPESNSTVMHTISKVQWPQMGITASTALRAALSVAIMQYTGLSEALFGSSSMGRQINMVAIEEVVGPTIATVPVRVTLKQEETISEFLQRVQEQAIQLTAIEQFGLQRIRLLGGNAEQACQFQTLLVVQPKSQSNVEDALFELSGKEGRVGKPVNEAATFSTYALMIECTLAEDGLLYHVSFDSEIMSSDKAQRFCYTFEQAIRQLCMPENNTKRLADLDLLSPQDLKSIWEWNSTMPESDSTCMHELISRSICRQPEATAVCAWDGELTYNELDFLSTRLAHKLVDRGIGGQGGKFVPLCFEKSKWTPVAMMGVMKAGGASVALDCNLPEQRLQAIVSQVSPQLILASARQIELAGKLTSAPVVTVDASLMEPLSSMLEIDALPTVKPSDAIYVVFTSGSTGTPKGAVMTHRGFSSAIRHQKEALGYSANSRTYNFVSHSFDVFWHDVLRTFAAGGCLCVPSEDDRLNDLTGSFERLRANSIAITPSSARLIDPEHVPGLKHLVMGGEPVTAADVSRWKGRVDNIISVYGPAECVPPITTASCDPNSSLAPSLGRGAGVNVWLVDPQDHNKLSAVGATGEALIEGPLVGEGYIGNKETSERVFIDAPSWLVRNETDPESFQRRLYKTGDLLRYNEDGTLNFVARKDAQVKLNGQRFELADVEQNLYQVIGTGNDVQLASEVITPNAEGKKLLVAFLNTATFSRAVKDSDTMKDNRTAWIAALENRLPTYMIPSAFIPLDEIPKTATGKLDRRRLRNLGASMTLEELNSYGSPGRERQPPTTNVECLLQKLWASVLKIEPSRIGANDSFLKIGGDSISAMRLVTVAKEQGLALTVADIFTKPILHELALSAKTLIQGDSTREIKPFSLLTTEEDIAELSKHAAILCGVSVSHVEDVFPCTPLQEALLAQTAKRAGDFTARFTLELRSSTEVSRFKRAWESVYDNNPILRTRIIELSHHGLVQVVLKESIRWGNSQTLEEIEMTKNGRNIGLGTSLMQNDLVEDEESGLKYFVWTIHHALYDGWSIPLLMEDLAQAYNGQVLTPSPPFQSFISYLQQSDGAATNAFWEGMFQGLEAPSWPVVASTTHQLRADTNFAHTITGVNWPRESNITASTILRATLAILMGEYSSTSEVLFGATVIGRQAPVDSIDRVTGPTITTVPIRIKLGVEQSIDELLHDIQKQGIDIMPFEQIGLKRLRRISDDTERACQFQTLLVVQPGSSSDDPSRQLFEHSIHADVALNKDTTNTAFNTYALQVVCDLTNDGLNAEFIADSTIIEKAQLRRMAFQFEHILRQICSVGQGVSKIIDIETVSAQDRAEIGTWNSNLWKPAKQCVLELLKTTSLRKPSATAVCAWDGDFTYAEFETLSTKLSYNLVSLGVKPGVTVPILFEKSKWMSISMIAVIKAGGTGVTLDSSLPENRLRSIVEQVNPKLIISSPGCEVLASFLTRERVVLVDDRRLAQLPSPSQNYQLPAVTPDDALYIAFTSGSTGRPKGVVVSHSQFSSAITYQQEALCITENSRIYEFVSYAWDGIWLHILFALAAGACLCVPSETDRRDRLAESMQALQANYVHLTPTVARMLNPSQVPDLKYVGLVGEAMLTSDKDQWTPFGIKVLNLYGPTECTPLSSCAEIGSESEGPLVIGKGFGANLWIVRPQDSSHDLAPIGAVGELVIDGPIVGGGYLSEAVSTSKVFVSNPPWLKQVARHASKNFVYKTGDLVRYTSDGNIVFVGRKDSQVKIRGQRVELHDIESHMRGILIRNAQPNPSQQVEISGFVDVLIPKESKTPILVAFLQVHSAEDLSQDELRSVAGQVVPGLVQQLASSLPAYMVPNFYIPLAHIATTVTGKIDRSSLRRIGELYTLEQLSALNPEPSVKRQPVSKAEVLIQQLWSQVLNINAENIGSDDSFFQVGGDSVSAMSLASIAREYGLSLTVSDIFKHPRLEDLATTGGKVVATNPEILPFSLLSPGMNEESVRAQAAVLCKMEPGHIEDVFPCTPMQEGLLAITARRAGAFTACYTLELQTSVDLDQFRQAWTEVLQATPILRTRIIDLPGQGLVQVISRVAEQWAENDSLDHFESKMPKIMMGLGLPLNLQNLIIEKETKRRFFIWTVHHALYDGWSRSLVMSRLEKAYRGEKHGESPPFQIFVKHLTDLNTSRCELFWGELLSGIEAPSFPSLPVPAYEPQADKSFTNVISNIDWPKGDITPSTIVKAAWSILTAEYTGVDEALFGVTVMGRQAVQGIEQMVGPTIATIPVRIVLNKQMPLGSLLRGVQEQAVDSMVFEQIGLQNLRRISSDTERACQFQTLLLIQPRTLADDTKRSRELFQHSLGDEKVANSDDINAAFSNYALQICCDLGKDDLTLSLVADTNVINEVQLRRIHRQLGHIIRLLCKTVPDVKLGDISITSPDDRQEIWQWNASVPETAAACVHDLIGKTVKTVDSTTVAINAWNGSMTYVELDLLSTRLAHRLCSLGVGRGIIVPLCFEKSVWTPVAQVAVMKAGGASVVLDTTLPENRLLAITRQVQPLVIVSSITNEQLASRLADATVVTVDRDQLSQLTDLSCALPAVQPSDLLYVVFTSGSTGLPKGALVTHQNFSSAIQHQQHRLGIVSTSMVYDFVSYAFDVAWSNLLQTLTAGACLCIPSEADRRGNIAQSIQDLRATYAHLTPTVARTINPAAVPGLQKMSLIGEPVSQADIQQWADRRVMLNTYGPAECTPVSTIQDLKITGVGEPQIGKGIGVNTWILRADGSPDLCAIGAVGELVIEGPIVGSGYLSDPAKSAGSFIEDPPWLLQRGDKQKGRTGRVYKTGDLVCYDWDGSLRFIGRRDTQVKIRGQRVELADIENNLQKHLTIKGDVEVVVDVLCPSGSNNSILVAFICPSSAATISELDLIATVQRMTTGIESKLGEDLPLYMIPNFYVPMPVMPATITGKRNRTELRRHGQTMTLEQLLALGARRQERQRPSTQLERQLQQIWASVLQVALDSIGSEDSFFQLGGDSIIAMRLVREASIRDLHFTIQDVFTHPRLYDLATVVEKSVSDRAIVGRNEDAGLDLRGTQAVSRSEQAKNILGRPVTSFQTRCIEAALREDKQWWNYISLDLPPHTPTSQIVNMCKALWDQFDILRTVFIWDQDRYLQKVPPEQQLSYIIEEHDGDINHFTRHVCLQDFKQPAILGACFTKFFIIATSEGERRLVLRLSHAQYDGMSLQFLLQYISFAFQGKVLPDSPRFTDFIDRNMMSTVSSDNFWQSLLQDVPMTPVPASQGPLDFAQVEAIPRASCTVEIGFSVTQCDVTPATVFTAACACVIAEVTATSDIVFGRLITGRSVLEHDLQEVVGPCVNFVPVRVAFDQGDISFKLAQQVVQEQYARGLPYQTTGLGDAVDPRMTQFGFMVHYLAVDDRPTMTLNRSQSRLDFCELPVGYDTGEVEIMARPSGESLHITATGGAHRVDMLSDFLDRLCTLLHGHSKGGAHGTT
ncbi:nonribosomal peptide synthase [Penicillium nucicola]|uniref:nonribosomal peptide synthase n=1 Tax=Penicillium nucicola TaxID=1850975 RepID=UPI0025458634|nr:nonribosomal peptide synthase [Penicillium nucicola]KAJ5775631.1 nonribosomal peptide synthase [Penicillium nucicola]